MTTEEINLLSLKKLCVINSSKTDKLFLDEKSNCYMFEDEDDTDKFLKHNKHTFATPYEYHNQNTFCGLFYSLGAKAIIVNP